MTDLRSKALAALAVLSLVVVPLLAGASSAAEKGRTVTPLGKNLDGWKAKGPIEQSKWTVGIAKLDPDNPRKLAAAPLGNNPPELITAEGHGRDIFSVEKFADCTVELEVMVPRGSNSGIYLMGEYEIQVLDSFGRQRVGPGDMGGLYGKKPPDVNAAKQPGEWQKFLIEFKAPRFKGGRKVANARLLKVTLNGQVIHQNVEIPSQCNGGLTGKEVPEGPLMFQGNHGPVAYRNIIITLAAEK